MTRSRFLVFFLLALVANFVLAGFNVTLYRSVLRLETRIDFLEDFQMSDLPVTRITLADGRVRTTYMGENETPEEFALRVKQLALQEEPAGHLCTTLTGCLPGGTTSIQHCTPYNGQEPSPAVQAQHKAAVAALCDTLECQDCG